MLASLKICFDINMAKKIAYAFTCSMILTNASYSQTSQNITPGSVQPQLDSIERPLIINPPKLDIPPVPERPLDTDKGPNIKVSRFSIELAANIQQYAADEAAIFKKMIDENPDGLTLNQMQEVAIQITQLYRSKGYILAKAILPEQNIIDGTVKIHLFPGILGQVVTQNNKALSSEFLTEPLTSLMNKPVEAHPIESTLLRINDLPGIDISGIFRAGKNVGETELTIKVNEEKSHDITINADNHGVETTGDQRLIGSINLYNIFGSDQLTFTGLKTFNPSESNYYGFDYRVNLSTKWLVGISYNTNDYVVGNDFNFLGIDGETQNTSLFTKYVPTRSRQYSNYISLSLTTKEAEINFDAINQFREDNLTVLAIESGFNATDSFWGGGINEGSISLSFGLPDVLGAMDEDGDGNSLRTSRSGNFAGGDFQKANINFERLQALPQNISLRFSTQLQFSNDLLSSIEQFSLGGPNSVRAYPVSEFIRDTAVFTSLEFIANAPGFTSKQAFGGRTWGEILQVSVYADYGWGRINSALASQNKEVDLAGIGIGATLRLPSTFFIRADVATPLTSIDATNDRDPQFWLSAGYQF